MTTIVFICQCPCRLLYLIYLLIAAGVVPVKGCIVEVTICRVIRNNIQGTGPVRTATAYGATIAIECSPRRKALAMERVLTFEHLHIVVVVEWLVTDDTLWRTRCICSSRLELPANRFLGFLELKSVALWAFSIHRPERTIVSTRCVEWASLLTPPPVFGAVGGTRADRWCIETEAMERRKHRVRLVLTPAQSPECMAVRGATLIIQTYRDNVYILFAYCL